MCKQRVLGPPRPSGLPSSSWPVESTFAVLRIARSLPRGSGDFVGLPKNVRQQRLWIHGNLDLVLRCDRHFRIESEFSVAPLQEFPECGRYLLVKTGNDILPGTPPVLDQDNANRNNRLLGLLELEGLVCHGLCQRSSTHE